jgi:hypothetical protein
LWIKRDIESFKVWIFLMAKPHRYFNISYNINSNEPVCVFA